MEIMIIGDIFPDSLAMNIAETLKKQGHSVVETTDNPLFNTTNLIMRKVAPYLIKMMPRIEKYFNEKIFLLVKKRRPEVIVCTKSTINPALIKRIKKEIKTHIVVWFVDSLANFGKQYIFASDYDALFFKDPFIVDFTRKKLNLNSYYLPECCNPLWHKKVQLTSKDKEYYGCDLTAVGNLYYYRVLLLEQFKDYNFKIWGNPMPIWMDSSIKNLIQNRYVSCLEKSKAFNAAKIVMNNNHYSEISGTNCRTFEIAGCGGFQITDWKEGIAELFEPEKEIITFQTKEELKDKVDYYLIHEKERKEIAERAYKRAHNEHTYEIRLNKIFEIINKLR